jgi:hypothetical protein
MWDWTRWAFPNQSKPAGWRVRVRVYPAKKFLIGFLDRCGTERTGVSGLPGLVTNPTNLALLSLSLLSRCWKPANLISNLKVRAMISNWLRMWSTEITQRPKQQQLQLQAVSSPQLMVSDSCSIQWLGHSHMTHPELATGRLLEHNMWNIPPFMSDSDLETACYATGRISKVWAESPHCQILERYWNTGMKQNNIWFI